ncbi:midasin [Aulographum hederae CBS 113979]|uniref:Midasin n=1 Tax=Aulographum hederae CBS 113979 TaxID=1176131 RepID=A0A6G1HD37_9PEZI|nr:midasin [Aulographum hederae CBS 113979]
MDCTRSCAYLLAKCTNLPDELQEVIRHGSNNAFLSAVSDAALVSNLADELLICLEPLIPEICARWIHSGPRPGSLGAFGRLVSIYPNFAECAEYFLQKWPLENFLHQRQNQPGSEDDGLLLENLLAIFRLLVIDNKTFHKFVRLIDIHKFLSHSHRPIRYLAVRISCIYLLAADAAMEEMIEKYFGTEEIQGMWEGKEINYRFLSLWEEKRYKDVRSSLLEASSDELEIQDFKLPQRHIRDPELSSLCAIVGGILVPRLQGLPSSSAVELVPTATTVRNLAKFAEALLSRQPVLLIGRAGSGKTSIVNYVAHLLNKRSSMVSLHLNAQSDAKLLVGMYTTGSTPGTFSWKPGVLTTAVREGRWVFIEDLDRAPNEIMSTLLPLIERGELLIPGRGEVIHAAPGFKIVATLQSTVRLDGQDRSSALNMIGNRFWNHVRIEMLEKPELTELMESLFPALQAHLPKIYAVYARLSMLLKSSSLAAGSQTGTIRPITPRDLLKWCRRVYTFISHASILSDSEKDAIFLEAFDCFAGSLPDGKVKMSIVEAIAKELKIEEQRSDYLMVNREIKHEALQKGRKRVLRLGRVQLPSNARRTAGSGRPFAHNAHTSRLLERLAVAVDRREPLLLVGETGTGKTTCIQHLADQLGRKLVPFNLSQQSESGDILGGFKPVSIRSIAVPLKDEFEELFELTFSRKSNQQFVEMHDKFYAKGQWKKMYKMWSGALQEFNQLYPSGSLPPSSNGTRSSSPENPSKKQKTGKEKVIPFARWKAFAAGLQNMRVQLDNKSDAFAFTFVEGNIVKALRNGDWVLLDEINLASPDTLESLSDLIASGPGETPSVSLTETGNVERIEAHPDFRIFAAMNPATDVGKKDLPGGIRSRFTEIYVDSPDRDVKSLMSIVDSYIGQNNTDRTVVADVTKLYGEVQQLASSGMLVDGSNQKPHFSLRTLTRTLMYARDYAYLFGLRRALYEGFHMSFLTFLDKPSEALLVPVIEQHLFGKRAEAEVKKPLRKPNDIQNHVQVGSQWLRQGSFEPEPQPTYIITPFVERNLNNLIRATSTGRYPILIQGPTSSGKTSMIEYLAKRSGNKFVRINNHEHTDLQEYLGTYISGSDGKLQFQEGILVKALREGHWIVLDELNLAPTDVLEALNRLLDDNRELLIPETQEVVRPHDGFMLFATQNPAGLYGGRKFLSRAFRNRFLELHFDDIPVVELQDILEKRTLIPPSWSHLVVEVYKALSALRQEDRLFEQKSFATLRDLFRWALRKADSVEELATNGYMLLAERVRKVEEREAVKNILETVMSKQGRRIRIDEGTLYSGTTTPEFMSYQEKSASGSIVWTGAMRRLFILVANAIRNQEPVLLVGETGCGKTTVCQLLAEALGKSLHIVNAHQNTETGDLIGAQRPVRNKAAIEGTLVNLLEPALASAGVVRGADHEVLDMLRAYDQLTVSELSSIAQEDQRVVRSLRIKLSALFEWSDGNLVSAMKSGQFFLLDEISLADDSVLERLNSVLEPGRTLLLAEKGPKDSLVVAHEEFQFFATMNPGGDFGKRELSPALRNRFTEIWVPNLSEMDDVLRIVSSKLNESASIYAQPMVHFAQWFGERYNSSATTSVVSIRDTLAWVEFVNKSSTLTPVNAILQGAAMVFIDTLGANPAAILAVASHNIAKERRRCIKKLSDGLKQKLAPEYYRELPLGEDETCLWIGDFRLPRAGPPRADPQFSFVAPTTRTNAMRIFRGLQLTKPILIEGSPGVGKTTLVTAISNAIGKNLARINLSEQTDLMDLFGSDAPVEGALAGQFAWKDAPFLTAMKNGDWVLLDEMNLASQSVLEGLNACLDHRGEVYVAELDQTFKRHPDFRLFAAQNPHHQGGGRKGLPASFVNRFTVVYADTFSSHDLALISKQAFPDVDDSHTAKLIEFVAEVDTAVVQNRRFGSQGGPWEFNLRDISRWLQLMICKEDLLPAICSQDLVDIIFTQRFRHATDRDAVESLFKDGFDVQRTYRSRYNALSTSSVQVGLGLLPRFPIQVHSTSHAALEKSLLNPLEALMLCVRQSWPVILVGAPGSGKSRILQHLAGMVGSNLVTFSMNADIDAVDLVGGYEQLDPYREVERFILAARDLIQQEIIQMLTNSESKTIPTLDDFVHLHLLLQQDRNRIDLRDLRSILASHTSGSVNGLVANLDTIMGAPRVESGARFEWVDGFLVQAIERGDWLVLDNANLCNSSVLDRLNSLLEPNGYLSINENSLENGEARIVRPHPNFRIFLTMDPHHGELSRAMRNRAVEIFIPSDKVSQSRDDKHPPVVFSSESSMQRFRNFMEISHTSLHQDSLCALSFDHLSLEDTQIVTQFYKEIQAGLLGRQISKEADSTISNLENVMSIMEPDWRTAYTQTLRNVDNMVNSRFSLTKAQPIHPLNNDILVRWAKPTIPGYLGLGTLLDLCFDIARMHSALQNARQMPSDLSSLTWLQRSLSNHRQPKFKKDATAKVGPFLEDMGRFLHAQVGQAAHTLDESVLTCLKFVARFWWNLFNLVHSTTIDEATYRVFLSIGLEEARPKNSGVAQSDIRQSFGTELLALGQQTRLSTGLCMEELWLHLCPPTSKSIEELSTLLQLESIAQRFDSGVFQFFQFQSHPAELIHVRERLRRARADTRELVPVLDDVIRAMEAKIPENTVPLRPHFQSSFDVLLELLDLGKHNYSGKSKSNDFLYSQASLFAQHSSRPQSSWQHQSSLAGYLQTITQVETSTDRGLLGQNSGTTVLKEISTLGDVPLLQMDLVQTEIGVLGEMVSTQTSNLDHDLYRTLWLLFRDLSSSTNELLSQIGNSASESTDLSMPGFIARLHDQHRREIEEYASICSSEPTDLDEHLLIASRGWISVGIMLIMAYVPDRPLDPALRSAVEHQMFLSLRTRLENSLEAFEEFNIATTGQRQSLRAEIISKELSEMGDAPPVVEIARPSTSNLNQLQNDFTALLNIVKSLLGSSRTPTDGSGAVTYQNLIQIRKRLTENYRAYDDIAKIAVWFIRCVELGLALELKANQSLKEDEKRDDAVLYMLNTVPLLDREASLRDCTNPFKITARTELPITLYVLETFALQAGVKSFTHHNAMGILAEEIFTGLFDAWKAKLHSDQDSAAAKSSLYTHRGGDDEEDEVAEADFESLFPSYGEDAERHNQISKDWTPKEAAIKLSTLHAQIFSRSVDTAAGLQDLLIKSAKQVPKFDGQKASGISTLFNETLACVLLALKNESDILIAARQSVRFNFYSDPCIEESKKLTALVHKTQKRFREIQKVWPEHATLADTIKICDELLAFRLVDPLAKLLTKTEKLHETIYEWQSVASKEFSAAELYEELTNLLVSWRQLELTTWSRLLDVEAENCADDAKSWWFVAYENLVAVPNILVRDGQDLKLHTQELLRTLEGFFESTPIGQFNQRLELLLSFKAHLAFKADFTPELGSIHEALDNFIHYFLRFQQPVNDALVKGRQTLEKSVKDILLLASWKDRTIHALRQSAKNSHLKLFKVVRKFRKLLSQPVSSILQHGLPDVSVPLVPLQSLALGRVHSADNPSALETCEAYVPAWTDRPARFKNVGTTVSLMHRMAEPQENQVDAVAYVDSFLSDLDSSITQLQKATPTVLTEENKEAVKHLKTRKRKLFADVLKELRQMGFKANLGGDALARQDSLAIVLANLPALPSILRSERDELEYYLHKTLHLMPQVREISRQHSDDLTSAEVSRSTSLLESILQRSIRQREVLVKASIHAHVLQRQSRQMAALSSAESLIKIRSRARDMDAVDSALAWISPVLKVAAEVAKTQAHFGKFEIPEVIDAMYIWASKFQGFLPHEKTVFPRGVNSNEETDRVTLARKALDDFSLVLDGWKEQHPNLAYLMRGISPWARPKPDPNMNGVSKESQLAIQDVKDEILALLDSMLGSFQDLEKAGLSIPSSTEDIHWMSSADQGLARSIAACHAAHIQASLQKLLDKLQHIEGDLKPAAAIMTVVLPLVEQYRIAYAYHVDQLANFHQATCKLSYQLAKSFVQIGKSGFCTPPEKSSGQENGEDEKIEGGTGLGEGEGAEDISKDIQDDEDLTELAQEPDKKKDGEIEDEKDAVDMDDEDMEGEMGDAEEKDGDDESKGSDDEGEDMEEDVGDVDDLGPSTMDEKMWDDGKKPENEKEKEGDAGKGTKNEDELAAQDEKPKQDGHEQNPEEDAEAGAEESEEVKQQEELEHTDPHLQQGENLDLPEELDIDGNNSDASDNDSMDDLGDDMDDKGMEDVGTEDVPPVEEDDVKEGDAGDDEQDTDMEVDDLLNQPEETQGENDEGDEEGEDKNDLQGEEAAEEEPQSQQEQDDQLMTQDNDANTAEDVPESDAQGIGNSDMQQDEAPASDAAAKDEQGTAGKAPEQESGAAGKEGTNAEVSKRDAVGRDDEQQKDAEDQPFKKLGDASDRWYHQQRQIQKAQEPKDAEQQQIEEDVDMADADFEHVHDDDQAADTQALGTASEEQAKAFDDSKAIVSNEKEEPPKSLEDLDVEEDEPEREQEDAAMEDVEAQPEDSQPGAGQQAPQAFIGDQKPFTERNEAADTEPAQEESDVEDVDTQLSAVQLDEETIDTTESDARALWALHESSTRTLSLSLTEQLRLILEPTLATKMRGDFRTGKRLNMKRIIPYIASQYKRDKIWMRRSVPSKRQYQIMLAVDDSKSMSESGSQELAFETLALVSKALTQLEAGELCIVGFGADVRVLHEFDKPFSSEAGVDVFRGFTFEQTQTDVQKLIKKSMDLFREARFKASGSGAELWQLQLIVSDGVCSHHDEIQKLVRQAQEERIMIVFVVVDSVNKGKNGEGKGIMDLQRADFDKKNKDKLVLRKYLDTFPFRWWIVVGHVSELPVVLSTALRQWFAETVG